jgi:hypothetical protein
MATQVVWHGTQQESFDLVNSIARNCTCEFGLMGVRLTTCAPHKMLTEDQRALNGLLFVRRMAERLRQEEWTRATRTAGRAGAADAKPARASARPTANEASIPVAFQ